MRPPCSSPLRPGRWGGLVGQTPTFTPSLCSSLPLSPSEQHPGGEGRLQPPHVGRQLHQKQVGDAGELQLWSGERGTPQPAPPFAGVPDPPKWALTPFSAPAPQTGPAAWGRTRRGLPLPARHRLHPEEPALHQRLRLSARGLAARQPSCPACLQLSITLFSVSQSVSPSLSLLHGILPVSDSHSQRQPSCSNAQGTTARPQGNGLVSFFGGNALPLVRGEGGGTGRRAMRSVHSRGGGSSMPPPSMSLGNGHPGPSSQHAQSRGFLFCII